MKERIEKQFGNEIRTIREQRGYHQNEIVDKYKDIFNEDLTQARLSSYETGKRIASLDTLLKISYTLDAKLPYTFLLNYYQNMWLIVNEWNQNKDTDFDPSFYKNSEKKATGELYQHNLISYLDSEDYGVDICKDDEHKFIITVSPKIGDPLLFTKKEFELFNRSVREFIEFQLYKKSSK